MRPFLKGKICLQKILFSSQGSFSKPPNGGTQEASPFGFLKSAWEALAPFQGLRKLRFRSFGSLQKLRKLRFQELWQELWQPPTAYSEPPRPFHSLVWVKKESCRDVGPVEGQRYPFGHPNCFVSTVSVLANEDRSQTRPSNKYVGTLARSRGNGTPTVTQTNL